MKRQLLTLLAVMAVTLTFAQFQHQRVYSTFDNLSLAKADTFNTGADTSGGFTHYGRYWNNTFFSWGGWSGWALSNMTDTVTVGFDNQYSAITGHGISGTPNYMVSTGNGAYIKLDKTTAISGAYFTNATYTARDMEQGSGFSKKFGGDDGDDPDFFRVIISSYVANEFIDSTIFYLADYRFADNSKDYIVKDWMFVDFNNDLENDFSIDSISFRYEGSDTAGGFGVNTPKYICMDDFNAVSESGPKRFGPSQFPWDTFYNGADNAGGFVLKNIFFPNSYNQAWNSWSGWSVSTQYDTTTVGFANQYSSWTKPLITFPESGFYYPEYHLVNSGVNNEMRSPYLAGGKVGIFEADKLGGLDVYITNASYAYLDMKKGSGFSKKFGGDSGNDEDYFRLIVSSISAVGDTLLTDTILLADYRFVDNDKDYILNTWKRAKITACHKVAFHLESTDNGGFGMNTPAYFCISLGRRESLSVRNIETSVAVSAYPNPAYSKITFISDEAMSKVEVVAIDGRVVLDHSPAYKTRNTNVDLSLLTPGVYFAIVHTDKGIATKKFIKQ